MSDSSDDQGQCETSYRNYLADLGFLVKEAALKAKEHKYKETKGSEAHIYETGRLMAFSFIIGLMQQQAEAFGIPLQDLRLEDIDPDKDLL